MNNSAISGIHINARSLRKNHDEINALLHSFKSSFSLVCISETWLTLEDQNLFGLQGYLSEYCNRTSSSHGGAAIFISPTLPYKRRSDLHIVVDSCESVWIELDKPSSTGKLIIGTIYRSPSSSISEFFSSLYAVLETLSCERKNVVIVGDLNIDLLEDTSNRIEYANCYQGFGYESLITLPTRCIPGRSSTLIDHVLSNFLSPEHSGVLKVNITDHYPVFFSCKNFKHNRDLRFSKSILNKEEYVNRVTNVDWSFIETCTDANLAFDFLSSRICKCIHDSVTVVKCKRIYSAPHNPWITNSLLTCMRKKENLYKKVKRRPFNMNLKHRYTLYSNTLNRLLKAARKSYYEEKIARAGNNSKEQWKIINSFLNKNTSELTITELQIADRVLDQPIDIANEFNSFYCKQASSTPPSSNKSQVRSSQSFYLFPTDPNEIISIIHNLKVTSPGLDGIHSSYIKLIANHIAVPLSRIINLIFKTGTFPSQLKQAKIIPVFKKGERTFISNYRPIAILSSFSKIIEKCIEKRITNYLSKFSILTPSQFGFRPAFSTNLALLTFTDKIKKAIDSGELAGALFIDLTKAFDSLNHSILETKLTAIGIVGPALTLIKSYLCNRQQAVYVRSTLSDFLTTNQGVPQGSILGPLLFLIYMNDLPLSVTNSLPFLYADDTTILATGKSIDSLTLKLQKDLNNILSWCLTNSLSINPKKTKFMIFHSANKVLPSQISIKLNGSLINPDNECSFLGIVLDSNLKYSNHVIHLRKKLAFGVRILIRARYYFNISTLIKLYYAFIHSHINYCITTWGNTYLTHLSPIQHIQNQAIRLMTFSSYRSSASSLLRNFEILSTVSLFKYHLIIMLFKSLHHLVPSSVFYPNALSNLNRTRFASNGNFLLPTIRTNFGRHTAYFSALSLWNSLPSHIKQCSTIGTFKKQLYSYLINY